MESLVRRDLVGYSSASNLSFNENIKNLIRSGRKIHHFGFGQSPFPVVGAAVEALKDNAGRSAYLPVAGLPELREEICSFHERHDGVKFNPENVIVAPGSKELIFLALHVFNGDVIVISPCWTTYKPQVLLANHKPYVIQTSMDTQWKITPHGFEKFLQENELTGNKLLIMNNPDNPTGTCYTESELRDLSEVFRRNNVIVISDEIYSRLNYADNHATLPKLYPEGTILSTSLSKWASAGVGGLSLLFLICSQLGYHVYPPELSDFREVIRSAASNTYTSAPSPMQYAAIEMFKNSKACDDYISHTKRIMGLVADYCHRELTSVGLKAVKPGGGFYIFPDFEVVRASLEKRGITTCSQMCEALLDEASVALMAGGPAFLRPVDELTTRLCFVNFDGTEALSTSRKIGLDKPLPNDFLLEYCGPVCAGIESIKTWVTKQLAN
ncbi:hypothetical protein ScPMuIL_012696 [Solemya velum]